MQVSIERPNIAKRGIPGRCILSVLGSQNNEQAMLCGTLQGCMQSGMASIALSVTHMHHDRRATPLQVLMLDSDNLPLRNPEYLFRTPQYQGGGSLFFSDWWDIVEWVKPEAYTAFGFEFPGLQAATLAAESGQVLLNRCAAPSS